MQGSTSVRWSVASALLMVAATVPVWAVRIAESPRHPPAVTVAWLVGLAIVAALPIGWLYRLAQWWRASRAPAERISVRLYHSVPRGTYRGLASSSAWARVQDGQGRRFYQRLMWEPWLRSAPARQFAALGHRSSPDGPMLIRTSAGGLLLWAGRPRPEPSSLEPLAAGPPALGRRRWTTVLLAALVGALLTMYLGPTSAVAGGTYFVGLVLLYGGAPLTHQAYGPEPGRRRPKGHAVPPG